jgi:hypothetical protein
MTKGLNRYCSLIGRCLLLAGYLFLFAGQFSHRYFSIANFYVYGNGGGPGSNVRLNAQRQSTHAVAVLQIARMQRGVVLHDNQGRATHLSIDKRFHLKESIRVPQIRAPGLPFYTIVKTKRLALTPVCFSIDLPVTSLRGPPCA